MPYRITYGPPGPPTDQRQDKSSRLHLLTAAWLIVFALVVRLFFPAGTLQLRSILLPDPENITQAAISDFMSDLRNGEPLGDALYAFCEHIIFHDPAISG